MNIVVTGSIAFDYLMSFPGKFTEHLLPEHVQRVSLSFLVDTMDKRRGGCAPNIAYTLALLGERPRLMATAGQDFGDYRQWLEAAGVDTSLVREVPGKFTASFFCSTDQENNQIASFYTGAMAMRPSSRSTGGRVSWRSSPRTIPRRCCSTRRSAGRWEIPFIFDPGQQCARMSGPELAEALKGATLLIFNDYELEVLEGVGGGDAAQAAARFEARSSAMPFRKPARNASPTPVGSTMWRGGTAGTSMRSADVRIVHPCSPRVTTSIPACSQDRPPRRAPVFWRISSSS